MYYSKFTFFFPLVGRKKYKNSANILNNIFSSITQSFLSNLSKPLYSINDLLKYEYWITLSEIIAETPRYVVTICTISLFKKLSF